jgi:hypothetical protein
VGKNGQRGAIGNLLSHHKIVLKKWYGSMKLDENSLNSVKQWCWNNVFTLFHCLEKH